MKYLYKPFPDYQITQGFGANANPLYAGQGLRGHTSVDYYGAWGTPIQSCAERSYCYSVLNKDNPDPTKYRSVYMIVELEGNRVDEISYGHANQILAEVGKFYDAGDTIMTMGNTGDVFAGGRKVTKEERLNGSKEGTHLHGPQVRACIKVTKTKSGKQYLQDAKGKFKKDGFYFEIIDYQNGYNGCVAPDFINKTVQEVMNEKAGLEKKIGLLTTIIWLRKKIQSLGG